MALLDEAVRRYFHTAAGVEAADLLGLQYLDRGRFGLAALCFGRRLDAKAAAPPTPATLFAAALALRLTGNTTRAAQVWNRLRTEAPSGARLGDRVIPLADLEQELARLQAAALGTLDRPAWGLYRGDLTRSGRGTGFLPQLEAEWTLPTAQEQLTREWIHLGALQQVAGSYPVLSGSVPVTVRDKVIHRTHRGVRAVDPRTGKALWESVSEWSFDRMVTELRHHPYLAAWVNGYSHNNGHMLFENTVLGTLSTDGARVYAVDDLPLPPYPNRPSGSRRRWEQAVEPVYGPELADAVHHSRLLAVEVETGKLAWEVGGRGAAAGSLADCHFLGAPLPLEGRLYTVVEKDHELRLLCLDAARGNLLWGQALVLPLNRLLLDVVRRTHAVHLAYADGMLICPTNDGAVLGVDLARRTLAWAYSYREDGAATDDEVGNRGGLFGRGAPRVLPRLRMEWRAATPVIHADRVLVTAPDTGAVHCLDLRTGTLRWKADRADDDLYLAGASGGKVLLVGKSGCRALHLADGRPAWVADKTGTPSGIGVIAGGVYYLPLKATATEKTSAVVALDLDRGEVRGRAVAQSGELVGNLVFCGDLLLSQTALTLTAYPQQD
jgi:outer membrane protein assembly factor BamB